MTLVPVTPLKAQSLAGDGALIVDIRSPEEFARAALPGAQNMPLGAIEPFADERAVVFICRTGRRSETNAEELAGLCRGQAYRLDGGIEGWRAAGLPLSVDRKGAFEIDQQALIANGSLVILSVLFAVISSPWYFLLTVLVGGAQIYEGLQGFSPMQWLLHKLPWNR